MCLLCVCVCVRCVCVCVSLKKLSNRSYPLSVCVCVCVLTKRNPGNKIVAALLNSFFFLRRPVIPDGCCVDVSSFPASSSFFAVKSALGLGSPHVVTPCFLASSLFKEFGSPTRTTAVYSTPIPRVRPSHRMPRTANRRTAPRTRPLSVYPNAVTNSNSDGDCASSVRLLSPSAPSRFPSKFPRTSRVVFFVASSSSGSSIGSRRRRRRRRRRLGPIVGHFARASDHHHPMVEFIYIYLIETRSIQEYSIRCTLSRVNTKDVVVVVYVVVRLVFRFSLLLLSSQQRRTTLLRDFILYAEYRADHLSYLSRGLF